MSRVERKKKKADYINGQLGFDREEMMIDSNMYYT